MEREKSDVEVEIDLIHNSELSGDRSTLAGFRRIRTHRNLHVVYHGWLLVLIRYNTRWVEMFILETHSPYSDTLSDTLTKRRDRTLSYIVTSDTQTDVSQDLQSARVERDTKAVIILRYTRPNI